MNVLAIVTILVYQIDAKNNYAIAVVLLNTVYWLKISVSTHSMDWRVIKPHII